VYVGGFTNVQLTLLSNVNMFDKQMSLDCLVRPVVVESRSPCIRYK